MPTAQWRKENPEKQKLLAKRAAARRWARIKDDPIVKAKNNAKTRAWYAENRERALAAKKKNNENPAVKKRRANNALLKMYGITLERREELFNLQGKKCAICKSDSPSRRWDTDHCHATGVVRGILCSSCNLMLGHGRDDEEILLSAVKYLKTARIIKR